ncbi:hypothetical protein HUO05_25825 (plasmid) [Vibrio alginolyticus]|uniref:hypothetical protein n=1 Tax=Vibrio alginolyticus TaxID=663 RepID=UPI00159314C2|nr:hypothetical protein [Vibrio alginolyticus]QKS98624.1 hypothetical protein HUO05_25825 [Vibrio alginolyticus]
MSKSINALWIGGGFLLGASVFTNYEVDWSVFTALCSASSESEVCADESAMSDDIESCKTLALEYRAPNGDDTRLFSELLSVYQALAQGKTVSELKSYICRLKEDIEARKRLYLYATGEGGLPTSPQRSKLRHYHKELMYLKSLQSINQKQMKLLNAHQGEDEKTFVELTSQVMAQGLLLDEAILAIRLQLKSDIKAEGEILRYFIYKREQAGESDNINLDHLG